MIITTDGKYYDNSDAVVVTRELLRDLFAACALIAVVNLNLEDATHDSDAAYAYGAYDAMLAQRTKEQQS